MSPASRTDDATGAQPAIADGSLAGLRTMLAGQRLAPCLTDTALLVAMLHFEAALARAQADCALVPRDAAQAIDRACSALAADEARLLSVFEPHALAHEARRASTLAIPFVKRLTAELERLAPGAGRYLHYGATSQDVVDSASMRVARNATRQLAAMLSELGDLLAGLADAHRSTLITGRTLLQAALPVSFGWKAAGWLDQIARARRLLLRTVDEQACLQFGGAAGTLAALGDAAPQVARALSEIYGLPAPATSWHAGRDRVARIGAELAWVCGAAARIGRDVSLLMQTEVAEAFEPAGAGRGGSSAMPHKRNPVGAMLALETALRAPQLAATLSAELVGEHERGVASWQNAVFVLAGLFEAAGSAVESMIEVIGGLRIDTARMSENLARGGGFVHAEAVTLELAATLGRPAATALVERICAAALQQGQTFREALAGNAQAGAALTPSRLDELFDPARQLAGATAMLDAVLADWRAQRGEP
jgi:3-carboxy-cis,cis-muconate cycloisomerase